MQNKIVDFNITQQGFHCWMCHQGISVLALFCNHCGGIQPVREADHFQRLGLERQIDVDFAKLERNMETLQRTFAPERFILRGHMEKNYAAKHLETVKEAYATLRDPIRRSRYWIDLNNAQGVASEGCNAANDLDNPTMVEELIAAFHLAQETAQLDKLAQRTGQEIEFGILRLLSTLRQQDWPKANAILQELNGLENLVVQLREKRQALTPQVVK